VVVDDPKGFQFDLEKTFAFRYMNMAWFVFVCIEEKFEPIFVQKCRRSGASWKTGVFTNGE